MFSDSKKQLEERIAELETDLELAKQEYLDEEVAHVETLRQVTNLDQDNRTKDSALSAVQLELGKVASRAAELETVLRKVLNLVPPNERPGLARTLEGE